MRVAQKGVEAFVAQAMAQKVPFAMETVFSYWQELPGGRIASKIDLIRQMSKRLAISFFCSLSGCQLLSYRLDACALGLPRAVTM